VQIKLSIELYSVKNISLFNTNQRDLGGVQGNASRKKAKRSKEARDLAVNGTVRTIIITKSTSVV
jgi:hypothetical protein